MKKILTIFLLVLSLSAAELPSYHCINIYGASFIKANGSIKPKVIKATGISKLNIMLEEDKKKKLFLNVKRKNYLLLILRMDIFML